MSGRARGQAARAGVSATPASPPLRKVRNRCLDCGDLTVGARCPDCDRAWRSARDADRPSTAARGYGSRHQRVGGRVVRRAKVCARCGQPARPGDPLVRGHLIPVSAGGDHRGGYQAEHRSCNSRAGAR